MDFVFEGLAEAFACLLNGDVAVYAAARRSLLISLSAVGIAAAVGLPFGVFLARSRFAGRRLIVLATRAAMAMPTVFIGVVCYGLFSRRGPFGETDLLYTSSAIVIGELFLALPIVIATTHGAIRSLDPRVAETAKTLGAGRLRRFLTDLSEARTGVLLALLTAFARCVSELGIAVMVGGNIKGRTRTLATAAALETSRGDFSRGLAMGVVLLFVALLSTIGIAILTGDQEGGRE